MGAAAVMARTPSFYKHMMTSEAFIRHYTAVADASPAPVILYNVTMYTGVKLLADAVGALSEHPNIVGVKECGNDMQLLADYPSASAEDFRRALRIRDVLLLRARAHVHGVLALSGHQALQCATA